jgi:hypothetical protein
MPKEQQWYWEFGYKGAKARNILDSFNKHFAPDDGESLENSVVESDVEVDMDMLFPQPVAMQEKVTEIRQRLLEG